MSPHLLGKYLDCLESIGFRFAFRLDCIMRRILFSLFSNFVSAGLAAATYKFIFEEPTDEKTLSKAESDEEIKV